MELTDNPRGTSTKQMSIVVAECKELRDACVGTLLKFGIRRDTTLNEIKLGADQNMYAKHAGDTWKSLTSPSGAEGKALRGAPQK